ncbi:MAG: hypothetical protein HC811_01890 [Flammeovirgaceae bacterium]|nr:hypothetical protein [Flammeovirgaceae bacterium]
MKILVVIILSSGILLSSCSRNNYNTISIVKPRYHKSWYKNHVHRKRIEVGRIKIKLFEKQGVKTVRAKM